MRVVKAFKLRGGKKFIDADGVRHEGGAIVLLTEQQARNFKHAVDPVDDAPFAEAPDAKGTVNVANASPTPAEVVAVFEADRVMNAEASAAPAAPASLPLLPEVPPAPKAPAAPTVPKA